ncbi:MAG: NAD(P)-binding protein [Lachnospiraceae bacterium]
MSRKILQVPDDSQLLIEWLYKDLERRIESSPPSLCPIDMTRSFLELCHVQTCGKCTPCRVGLGQLIKLLTDVLDGNASMETLALIEETALVVRESSDCAIGYEAANMVCKGIVGFREEFESHILHGKCMCQYKNPVPCVALCPAAVDIPGYIALVREGRYADAIRLIRKDNPFPTTCGFICENPCEARCRRNIIDSSINIRGIKRFAADYAGEVAPPACAESTGKRVAILGGGPGGLSAGYYLQLMGHQTCVYEMLPKLGGMLRYGIPNYRLPKDRLDQDIDAILKTGVELRHGMRVGEDITIAQLREEYDAVLITIGASTFKKLGLEHEDAEGIMPAITFLRESGFEGSYDFTGEDVVIIGGGNVAMDAVRTAVRLGARKVSTVYRRRMKDMTALPLEIESAVAEGVEMLILKAPSRICLDEKGKLIGIYVTPQMISSIRDGRASVRATGEPEEFIPCTRIISAIGQNIETKHMIESGVPIERGVIKTTSFGGFDDMPDVFAGGDCSSGPSTVIKAIAAAKVVAANIDEFLGFQHTISCDVKIPTALESNLAPCGRVDLRERESSERKTDFEGVELCMTEAEAMQECGRCMRCDHYGYGVFKGGRSKVW